VEQLFYVMAILGCGDNGSGCTEARLADRQYRTRHECARAVESQLLGSSDIDFPMITARCVSAHQYVAGKRDRRKATMMLAGLRPAAR